jgi:hypothetical protein
MTPSRIEPATFRLVAQCLNHKVYIVTYHLRKGIQNTAQTQYIVEGKKVSTVEQTMRAVCGSAILLEFVPEREGLYWKDA